MIEIGNIITLENDLEYLVLEELNHGSQKYIYTVRTLQDETPTDEYLIFEIFTDATGEYLSPVDDKALYDELLEEFKNIVADKVLNGELDDIEELTEEA